MLTAKLHMVKETPPRAWGRPKWNSSPVSILGNTPTGVGKTRYTGRTASVAQKHPHGRGEDLPRQGYCRNIRETPPRAWGRLGSSAPKIVSVRKHPHGRGEDLGDTETPRGGQETPPRAWGRLQRAVSTVDSVGNTPTGVGKTGESGWRTHPWEKHPHGRGEDNMIGISKTTTGETPPRAWGRRYRLCWPLTYMGNTPTGVGKTKRLLHTMLRM